MNGSIQTAGPRTTTPLRTSNPPTITNRGPLRRPLFKSQIPIRIDFGAAGSQPSQQALLHAQALEQRRQMFSASQNSPSAALQVMRTSSHQQPLKTAIKFYRQVANGSWGFSCDVHSIDLEGERGEGEMTYSLFEDDEGEGYRSSKG